MLFSWRFGLLRMVGRSADTRFVACLLAALMTAGCATVVNEASTSIPNDPEFRDRLDTVGKTYESKDVQRIIEMYASDTYSLSFDQTIAFDTGAPDHRGSVERLLAPVETLKIDWDPQVTADRTSARVWTTRHFKMKAKLKSGEKTEFTGWHSAIWEQRDGKWLIAYEHFTGDRQIVAMPPPPPARPAPEALTPEAIEAAARDSIRDVFFDYDKWNLRDDQLPSIGVVLDYLKKYPTTEMTIEGHCDERGSTRYNIELGQKRADETKTWLVGQGIAAERLRTISFGKSRPFEEGKNQEAWQSNRRSHFVVTKGPQRP